MFSHKLASNFSKIHYICTIQGQCPLGIVIVLPGQFHALKCGGSITTGGNGSDFTLWFPIPPCAFDDEILFVLFFVDVVPPFPPSVVPPLVAAEDAETVEFFLPDTTFTLFDSAPPPSPRVELAGCGVVFRRFNGRNVVELVVLGVVVDVVVDVVVGVWCVV